MPSRRRFLSVLSAGALAGCTAPGSRPLSSALQAPGGRLNLAPVAVDDDRVIRTVVGLRPFRPSGFVVRAEKIGDKTIVHDYGHGGCGMTLSWGTAELALELGFVGENRAYAVIGSGGVGLATARLLQRRGGQVTIYAKALPPDTTSNIAGALWWPTTLYDADKVTPEFHAQLLRATRLSHQHFQTMLGDKYGVRWVRNYTIGDHPIVPDALMNQAGPLGDLVPEQRVLRPDEHPFAAAYVEQHDAMMIEPPIYLNAVMRDFLLQGGKIVLHDFHSPAEFAALPESVIFNCTGLGAKALFNDAELTPVRGQLTVLLPQPEVTYNLFELGNDVLYMFPRRDGILLGGTHEHGNWNLTPDPAAKTRIMAGHRAVFAAMKA